MLCCDMCGDCVQDIGERTACDSFLLLDWPAVCVEPADRPHLQLRRLEALAVDDAAIGVCQLCCRARCLYAVITLGRTRRILTSREQSISSVPTERYQSDAPCFEIHICWNVDKEARMEPPIQTEYLRSGGATILTFMDDGASAVISFCIRSEIPGYMVVPPDMTMLP